MLRQHEVQKADDICQININSNDLCAFVGLAEFGLTFNLGFPYPIPLTVEDILTMIIIKAQNPSRPIYTN